MMGRHGACVSTVAFTAVLAFVQRRRPVKALQNGKRSPVGPVGCSLGFSRFESSKWQRDCVASPAAMNATAVYCCNAMISSLP